jgi:Txe/YoeB family toxin of Txe-Axe toxin-antitoxin module|tara:strand:- start:458 stop:886 length:429 start_codon:yes stop_codon:yes gene_type:complete
MNKTELKKILRPLIKECIKEVIFEEGALSTIISEVVKGTSQTLVQESKPRVKLESEADARQRRESKKKVIQERQKKLLDSIGRDAYNGVDLFEGTTPLSNRNSGTSTTPYGSKALDGVDPHDAGVDISKFSSTGVWKKLAGK